MTNTARDVTVLVFGCHHSSFLAEILDLDQSRTVYHKQLHA